MPRDQVHRRRPQSTQESMHTPHSPRIRRCSCSSLGWNTRSLPHSLLLQTRQQDTTTSPTFYRGYCCISTRTLSDYRTCFKSFGYSRRCLCPTVGCSPFRSRRGGCFGQSLKSMIRASGGATPNVEVRAGHIWTHCGLTDLELCQGLGWPS